MVMSTQVLAEAANLLATALIDEIQLGTLGEPVTVGIDVTREFTPVGDPIPGLVQTTTLANAAESQVQSVWSIKVRQGTPVVAGMGVEVLRCDQEPSLVGKRLLIDKVSENGSATIRKAVASDALSVNQEGKGVL